MELNEKKDKIQDEAVQSWIDCGKKGTIESITGSGKNFMFLKALYTMPLGREKVHLFLAETKERERDFRVDVENFNKAFKKNVFVDYNLQFFCYQTVYKWNKGEFGLVGCDEIHDQLSPEYVRFHLKNKYDAVLGLSAKIQSTVQYTIKRDFELRNFFNKDMINKHDILEKIAPICFSYTVNDGQRDNTSRLLNIYIIKHKLNNSLKCVQAGSKKKPFMQTELQHYNYLQDCFNKSINLEQKKDENYFDFEERKDVEIKKAVYRRTNFLYKFQSKNALIKRLLMYINQKCIIFGNSIESLESITPNAVVSSHNTDIENDNIRNKFNANVIKNISSFKKLKQGANIFGLDVCIIKDYYSSEIDFIQRIGRLRQNNNKIGHVFIPVTLDTQEVVWFNKMIENCNQYNYIICENVEEAIKEYNKYNT